jgi:hypothetical protein
LQPAKLAFFAVAIVAVDFSAFNRRARLGMARQDNFVARQHKEPAGHQNIIK